jgi:multiple sugar transport system permease protein
MAIYRRWRREGAVFGALSLYTVFALGPVIWILLMSFKQIKDIVGPPTVVFSPTFENYTAVFTGGFLTYYWNTFVIAVGSIVLSAVIGIPAAYALARFRFRFRDDLAFAILSIRFAPELSVLLPLFLLYKQLGLYDTYLGLILVYQLVTLPLFVWIMRGFFEEIPREVEDAAKTDGASLLQTMWYVMLPLVRPGLAATVILSFIFAWNGFVFGLVLASNQTQPVTLGLLGYIGFDQVQWGEMAAATMVTILPEVVLAALVQRHLVRGLTFGAVKG